MTGIQRWTDWSWQAAVISGASSARKGRSSTTPSLRGGFGGLSFSGMIEVCRFRGGRPPSVNVWGNEKAARRWGPVVAKYVSKRKAGR
jgi:hypothetical protein